MTGSSRNVEWCEIGGSPTEQERQILLAALDQYLRSESRSSSSAWADPALESRQLQPAQGWAGPVSWNGLLPRS